MTDVEKALDSIERATALDPVAAALSSFWSKALSAPKMRDLLSGRQIGHPLHPAAVLVPAGTLLSATMLDLTAGTSMRPASRRLIALGLLAAVPAATAGWSDWLDTEGAERRVGLVHATANALGLSAYLLSLRRRRAGGSGRLTSLAGAAALGMGGWLGGHLAYAQGVGVDTTAFQTGPADWTDVAAVGDVGTTLHAVDAAGVALLLTLVDGRPVAIADRCTHRGAPLSDGARDGDCVVCPWHGSRFDLGSGAVRQGPASRPQPVYAVRESAGRIEVRRNEPRALRRNPAGV